MSKIDLTKFSYLQRLSGDTPQGGYPYNFVSQKSNKLVITIGDSWTWGADITPFDDTATRLEKSYGGILSRELSADYLNLGQCGSCNLHIIERVKELTALELEYDKIYVVCTFTEATRSLDGPYDRNINYFDWMKINPVNKLLEFHNSIGAEYLTELSEKVILVTGCNFVDPVGIQPTLSKTWVEIYNESTTKLEYEKPCYIMSHWVIDKLYPFINKFNPTADKTLVLEWISNLLDAATERKKLVSDQSYYGKVNHPLELGHKLWARYILENLNE